MTQPVTPSAAISSARPVGFRVWHLWLISALVAVAIANIRDERLSDPKLITLAAAGFVLYATLGWAGWRLSQRFRDRLGAVPLLALYLTAMATLYLIATVVYLVMEHVYQYGL